MAIHQWSSRLFRVVSISMRACLVSPSRRLSSLLPHAARPSLSTFSCEAMRELTMLTGLAGRRVTLLPTAFTTTCLHCCSLANRISPLSMQASKLHFAVRHVLVRETAGRCALMLLEAGASVELMRRFSLCQFAAASTAAIQALINRGVVVREIVGRNGTTPLHGAARFARDILNAVRWL
jgi:hypothetical protein